MKAYTVGAKAVRENFSLFLDEASKRPGFINRRRENYMLLPLQTINKADFGKVKVRFDYDETNDGRVYFTKNSIFPDVIGWGDSKEEALKSFIDDLVSFCTLFYDEFPRYSEAPNRRSQIMPVLRVISLLASDGDILSIVEAGDI